MKASYKFRIYPSKSQKRELFRQMERHCALYNFCLQERIDSYEKTKTSPSVIDQIKANVPVFKDKTNVSSLQQTVRRLDKSFQNFFRRVKLGQKPGFPRFKKRLDSVEFVAGDGAKALGDKLYIQHVGKIKMIAHRALPKYFRVTIKYQAGQFFASFVVEAPPKVYQPSAKTLGLDFGLKTFVTTSDGEKVESPKFLRKNLARLSKAASKRDLAAKGTPLRKKRGLVIRNIFRKVSNQRADFNHKLSTRLVAENGALIIEDLDIQKLSGGEIRSVNRTYNDVSWAQFAQMLTYKAASAGRKLVRVNPMNTSKTCSSCGRLHDMPLSKRLVDCECGNRQDRDINAARNILASGLRCLAQA